MAATKTYTRTLVAARRIGDSFRDALRSIDGAALFERIRHAAHTILEGVRADRHSPAFVRAILEAAADEEVNSGDARKFAQHFLSKKPYYSNSSVGVAAVLFETWLAKAGGLLYSRFVETVLDNGDTSFLAIFEGQLGEADIRRMRSEVGSFATLEPVIEAGQVNYADGEIVEFTMFDCRPTEKVSKVDLERLQPSKVGPSRFNSIGPVESLLPSDRAGYLKVCEDGGLSAAAARYVFGDSVMGAAYVERGSLVIEDKNGVRWESVDGATWAPSIATLDEGTRPPRYQRATGVKSCATCTHFDAAEEHCEMFDWPVKSDMTCDRWAGTFTSEASGVDEGYVDDAFVDAELIDELGLDAEERWTADGDLELAANVYERGADGTARSYFNAWAVDSASDAACVVEVDGGAWEVPVPVDYVIEVIDGVASTYPDLLAEGDKAIEAALVELVDDEGGTVQESLTGLLAEAVDRPTVADREAAIRRRLSEAEGKSARDADTLCSALALRAAPLFRGKLFDCRFDGRVASGTVFVKFTSAVATAPEIDHLNAKIRGMIVIGPFNQEGVATTSTLRAELIRASSSPAELGWRNKVGSLRAVREHVAAFLASIADKIATVSEAEDDEDEGDAEGGEEEPQSKAKAVDKPTPNGSDGDAGRQPPEEPDDDPGGEAKPDATDHMDEPDFYRDDIQAYYDMMIGSGKSSPEAVSALKKRFNLRRVEVTPTGEVRSPGVTDNPQPPTPPAAAPPPPDEAPPEEEPAAGNESPPREGDATPEEESVDALWLHYLSETDHPVEDFEQWVLDVHPAFADELRGWSYPTSDTVSVVEAVERLKGRARWKALRERSAAVDAAARYARFSRLVNMRPLAIREHLRSKALRETLAHSRRSKTEGIRLGVEAARHVMHLKALPLEEWGESEWQWCNRAVRYIERTLRTTAPCITEDGRPTRKLLALRAWGHDPVKASNAVIDESEVMDLVELGLTRVIDPHTANGPVQVISESAERHVPKFDVLQANRVTLTDEERRFCLDEKAVRPHSNGDTPTPAVWKAEVDGETWYVTNTHRAYSVAPTMEGATCRYHKFIKSTG